MEAGDVGWHQPHPDQVSRLRLQHQLAAQAAEPCAHPGARGQCDPIHAPHTGRGRGGARGEGGPGSELRLQPVQVHGPGQGGADAARQVPDPPQGGAGGQRQRGAARHRGHLHRDRDQRHRAGREL